MSKIAYDGEIARQAAGRIDTLADSLAAQLQQRRDSLSPVAAALDPVSGHTAATLTTVSDSFADSYGSGVTELRKIAANLRAHADLAVATEDDTVALFTPLG
ncbi:PE domain-containing protein [Nocardia sp. NPDC003979]